MTRAKPIPQQVAELGPAQAVIGHNAPPTPFDEAKKRLDDLVDEARLYADGAKIETQELADDFSNLQRMIQDQCKVLEQLRKDEKKPLDLAIAEIQDRFNPLISENKNALGSGFRAINALKAAQEPFLVAKAARIAAEAKRLADLAAEAEKAAQEALRASNPENLAEREGAEQLVTEANQLKHVASFASKQTAKAGGTFGRATGLTTVYTFELIDATACLKWAIANHAERVRDLLRTLGTEAVRFGDHTEGEIPGGKIIATQKVR
jgi:hypothetical protein